MRFKFTADKILLDQLVALQETQHDEGEKVSKSDVVVDAVQMLFQIDTLLAEGYKFAIIDPKGKQHILRRGKEEDDESE